jgi:antitoxin (DNA-binding transcriptional repressor) of toxin-antitoxin stability system
VRAPKTIAQRELRDDSAKVIDAVVAGESFVITRDGIPVAELRPLQNARRTLVPKAQVLVLAPAGPRIDGGRLRRDVDRLTGL